MGGVGDVVLWGVGWDRVKVGVGVEFGIGVRVGVQVGVEVNVGVGPPVEVGVVRGDRVTS